MTLRQRIYAFINAPQIESLTQERLSRLGERVEKYLYMYAAEKDALNAKERVFQETLKLLHAANRTKHQQRDALASIAIALTEAIDSGKPIELSTLRTIRAMTKGAK